MALGFELIWQNNLRPFFNKMRYLRAITHDSWNFCDESVNEAVQIDINEGKLKALNVLAFICKFYPVDTANGGRLKWQNQYEFRNRQNFFLIK